MTNIRYGANPYQITSTANVATAGSAGSAGSTEATGTAEATGTSNVSGSTINTQVYTPNAPTNTGTVAMTANVPTATSGTTGTSDVKGSGSATAATVTTPAPTETTGTSEVTGSNQVTGSSEVTGSNDVQDTEESNSALEVTKKALNDALSNPLYVTYANAYAKYQAAVPIELNARTVWQIKLEDLRRGYISQSEADEAKNSYLAAQQKSNEARNELDAAREAAKDIIALVKQLQIELAYFNADNS